MSEMGERELLAIIFTDAVDSTMRTASDEDYSLQILLADLEFIRNEATVRGGTVLKNTGDGLLICFQSAVDALECGLSIQNGFAGRAKESAFVHKIGVHIGDVIKKNGDIYGTGVNTASRLVDQCQPGELCVSSTLYELVKQKNVLRNLKTQAFHLKNVEPALKAYHIYRQDNTTEEIISIKKYKKQKPPFIVIFILIATLCLIGIYPIAKRINQKNQEDSKLDEKTSENIKNTNCSAKNQQLGGEIIGYWRYNNGAFLTINSDGTVLQTWQGGSAAGKIRQIRQKEYLINYLEKEWNSWHEKIKVADDGLSLSGINNFGQDVFAAKQDNKNKDSFNSGITSLTGIWRPKFTTPNESPSTDFYYIFQTGNTVIIYAEEKNNDPRYSYVIVGNIYENKIDGTLYDMPKGKESTTARITAEVESPKLITFHLVDVLFEWSISRE